MEDKRQNEPNRLQQNLEKQEVRYKSERVRNAVLQARLETLRERIRSLEEQHLNLQTSNELQAIKRELAQLQVLIFDARQELGGLKDVFRRLWEALRPQKPHS